MKIKRAVLKQLDPEWEKSVAQLFFLKSETAIISSEISLVRPITAFGFQKRVNNTRKTLEPRKERLFVCSKLELLTKCARWPIITFLGQSWICISVYMRAKYKGRGSLADVVLIVMRWYRVIFYVGSLLSLSISVVIKGFSLPISLLFKRVH